MGRIVTVVTDNPCQSQVLTLGGAQYRLRLTWRERLAGWYADLWDAEGAQVWAGVRVSSSWALGFGLSPENRPDGIFLVRGPNEARRQDLGASQRLVFYGTDELPEIVADDLGLVVTVS